RPPPAIPIAVRTHASTIGCRTTPCDKNLCPSVTLMPHPTPRSGARPSFRHGFVARAGARGWRLGPPRWQPLVKPVVAPALGEAVIIQGIHVLRVKKAAPYLVEALIHIGHVERNPRVLRRDPGQRELQAPARLERDADRASQDGGRRAGRQVEL